LPKETAVSKLRIIQPKDGSVFTTNRPVVAIGRADTSIVGVRGACRPTGDSKHTPGCETFFYILDGTGIDGAPSYRWAILCSIREPGAYRLTVTGIDADCGQVSAEGYFEVVAAKPATGVAGGSSTPPRSQGIITPFVVIIIGIDNNDDITDMRDDFVPSGFTNRPLASVTLTEETTGATVPNYPSYDTTSCLCWAAIFSHIPMGSYTLTVVDDQGNSDTRTGLHVDV
jgi:hypothetical protein